MKLRITKPGQTENVAKRAFYLAWKACGGPLGLGHLHDNPVATADDVWKNIVGSEDYPSDGVLKRATRGFHTDYVFGRMMKLYIKIEGDSILIEDDPPPTVDYQAWCGVYPTYQSLIEAAAEELGATAIA